MRKDKGIPLLFLIIVLVLIVGIGSGIYLQRKSEQTYKIIFVSKSVNASTDFWYALMEGTNAAAKDYNAEVTTVGPDSESDYETQNEQIEAAIAKHPDAILLCPADYEKTAKAAEKIKKAGIKLVLIDSLVKDAKAMPMIATDNYAAGEKLGRFMKMWITNDTQIAIVGHVEGASTAIDRIAGIKAALGSDSDKIVRIVYSDSDYDKAYEATKTLLTEYPQLSIIAGTNENSAVGAARAVKEMGLAGKVHLLGFDSSKEEVQLLEEGVFDAIVVQKAFNMGYLGIEATIESVQGKKVAAQTDSGSKLVTKYDMYTEENQKLLFPFW